MQTTQQPRGPDRARECSERHKRKRTALGGPREVCRASVPRRPPALQWPRRRQTASGPVWRAGSRQEGKDGSRPHVDDTDTICGTGVHVRGLGRKRRGVHLDRRGTLQEDRLSKPPLCAPRPRHRAQTGLWTRCAVPASPLGLSGSEEGGGKQRAGAQGRLPSLPSSTVCVTARRGEAGRTPSPQARRHRGSWWP